MYLRKRKLTLADIKRLSIRARVILALIWGILFFVFWQTQIINHHKYTELALKNISRKLDLNAPRGLILDRNGKIMAENRINFSLTLVRENVVDLQQSISLAAHFSGKTTEQVTGILRRYNRYPLFFPIPIQHNLPLEQVIYILSREEKYPEFKIETEPMRAFPNATLASHLLGYLSEISDDELRQEDFSAYRLGDRIGRSGLERQYEENLRGRKGYQLVIKDSIEKVQQVLETHKPQIGETLHLTIDLELQQFVEDLLFPEKGCIAVVDLKDGGLLALASKPDFSPDFFTGTMEQHTWLSLADNPEYPLQNRFIQGRYPPGSTFKIIVALAALQENIVNQRNTVFCSGGIQIYDRYFNCWNSFGHGQVNLVSALADSCNVYFYQLGRKLDIDDIARYANMLGLGEKTGLDLPHEAAGLIPDSAWKMRTFNQKWFPGETISAAIGQGSISITPAQMLTMIATVALRGRKPELHLVQRIENQGRAVFTRTGGESSIPINPEHFETVISGLHAAVNNEGTARGARIEGLDICGKTGTAQIIAKDNPNYKILSKQKRFKPHSWFVSFAPRDNPRIAMVVLVENGGDGGAAAAPLSKQIYRYYFDDKKRR